MQDRVSKSPNSQNTNSMIDLCFGLYYLLTQEMLNVVFLVLMLVRSKFIFRILIIEILKSKIY